MCSGYELYESLFLFASRRTHSSQFKQKWYVLKGYWEINGISGRTKELTGSFCGLSYHTAKLSHKAFLLQSWAQGESRMRAGNTVFCLLQPGSCFLTKSWPHYFIIDTSTPCLSPSQFLLGRNSKSHNREFSKYQERCAGMVQVNSLILYCQYVMQISISCQCLLF